MIKFDTSLPLPPLLLMGALLSATTCATADDNDDHGPPIEELFKTELVFPQEQGALQVATLPTYRDGPEGSAFVLPVGLEYGITDSLQIEAEYEFASGDRKFLEGGIREDSQELYLIFAKDLAENSKSQLFLQVDVELQKDGRPSLSFSETDLDETEGEEGDDDTPHDPNVWFANIGGYTNRSVLQ